MRASPIPDDAPVIQITRSLNLIISIYKAHSPQRHGGQRGIAEDEKKRESSLLLCVSSLSSASAVSGFALPGAPATQLPIIIKPHLTGFERFGKVDNLAGVIAEMFDDVEEHIEHGLPEALGQTLALQRFIRLCNVYLFFEISHQRIDFSDR